jgi:hypothetical protein
MSEKFISILLTILLLITFLPNLSGSILKKDQQLIIPISFQDISEIHIIKNKDGDKIELDDFSYLIDSGKPLLPSKNFLIALPPGTKIDSLNVIGFNKKQITGYYEIIPSSKIIPKADISNHSSSVIKSESLWQDNHELIYSSDNAFPDKLGRVVGEGSYHEYSYVAVSICPFNYHPKSGRLYYFDSVEIVINYLSSTTFKDFKWDTQYDEKSSKLFVNYKDIKTLYQKFEYINQPLLETYDYVIITTNNLIDAIIYSDFIDWKTSIGFNLKIVSITDTEISNQPGVDLAEQIRNFLRQYYNEWGIRYVLFIGNYEKIPMRYCYPDPTNHRFDPFDMFSGEVPTDYYYADLSSSDAESWDSDGDGYHGEYFQDNPDFLAEVSVGRIPTNDAIKITYTLDKTVSFEQDIGNWKNNALNAGAFFYFTNQDNSGNVAMDGADLSYYIEKDLMDGWTISHYSEREGLETSIYDWPALNEDAFISDWRNGQYSIVNWQGHGWTNRVTHCFWATDDGDGVPESTELSWPDFINVNSDLDDDYPSIVTAVSCYVGCPELNGGRNLGIDLLTNPLIGASVGVVASARSPYGSFDWSPSNPGGSDSIIYEFNKNMIINHERVGDALYNSKFYCNYNFGWTSFYEYIDVYTFNLYGDPSLVLQGINVEGKPEKPLTPTGPSSGKLKEEYTYKTSSTDPDNDQLYYMWDWDDGTMSEWLGPYDSGEECSASHIWNNRGSYNIKVKAKDEKGGHSSWSNSLSISMSKWKYIQFPLIKWFLNKFELFMPKLNVIIDGY